MIRGLMSDDEWAVFERFLASPSKQGGRPPKNHRRVLDGVFWIARTGALGVICRPSLETGTRFRGNSVAGASQVCGT